MNLSRWPQFTCSHASLVACCHPPFSGQTQGYLNQIHFPFCRRSFLQTPPHFSFLFLQVSCASKSPLSLFKPTIHSPLCFRDTLPNRHEVFHWSHRFHTLICHGHCRSGFARCRCSQASRRSCQRPGSCSPRWQTL